METPLHLKLLLKEFERRVAKNPRYTQRAFALSLNVDPSLLTKYFSEKRKISPKIAAQLLDKLAFTNQEKKFFLDSVLNQNSTLKKISLSKKIEPQVLMDADHFETISEPIYSQLLELASMKSFKLNRTTGSRALKISEAQTQDALERLNRLGFLELDHGHYRRTVGQIQSANFNVSTQALREYQKKVLNLAISKLDEVPISNRHQQSMTIASTQKKIDSAKIMIQDFISRLTDHLYDEDANQIYILQAGLFPIIQDPSQELQ